MTCPRTVLISSLFAGLSNDPPRYYRPMPSDPDAIEALFGNGHGEPHEDRGRETALRIVVGRPRMWVSCVWCGIGLTWLALTLVEPAVWRLVLGIVWLVLGLVMGIVAYRDRRKHRGFYDDHTPPSNR